MQSNQKYVVAPGLRTLLAIAISDSLPASIETWKTEIESGVISDQLLRVLIAMDWVTSTRDARITKADESTKAARQLDMSEAGGTKSAK